MAFCSATVPPIDLSWPGATSIIHRFPLPGFTELTWWLRLLGKGGKEIWKGAFMLSHYPRLLNSACNTTFLVLNESEKGLRSPRDKRTPRMTVSRRAVPCREGSRLGGEAEKFCRGALRGLACLGGCASRRLGQTQRFLCGKQKLLALDTGIRSKICVQTCSCCPSLELYSHPNKQHMGNLR